MMRMENPCFLLYLKFLFRLCKDCVCNSVLVGTQVRKKIYIKSLTTISWATFVDPLWGFPVQNCIYALYIFFCQYLTISPLAVTNYF